MTHSPTGSRRRWTVRSVLTNRWRSNSRTRLTPLPKSAAAATRASGEGSSPPGSARGGRGLVGADRRAREADPGERRADAVARPAREADLHRGPVEALGVARL